MSTNEPPDIIAQIAADMGAAFDSVNLGHYGLSISGSSSKGTWDARSDIDFRLYVDQADIPAVSREHRIWNPVMDVMEHWRGQGISLDDIGPQLFTDVDAMFTQWLSGDITPIPMVWTIWGYHPMPDFLNMLPVSGDVATIERWKRQAVAYPDSVKTSVFQTWLPPLQYWPNDYHYENKAHRGDRIFLSGLTSHLVHACAQLLCAHNRVWFTGDGNLARTLGNLPQAPDRIVERTNALLYPEPSPDMFIRQREDIVALCREVLALVTPE